MATSSRGFSFALPDSRDELLFAPQKFTTPDGDITASLHDADTLYTDDGTGIRFGGGVDAAETDKFTEVGGYAAGSLLGNTQARAVQSIISDYSHLPSFTKGAYNRQVAEPTNPLTGRTISRDMIVNDIVPANAWTSEEDMRARAIERFSQRMNPDAPPTKLSEARKMVEETLRAGTVIPRQMANTVEDYQDYVGSTSFKGLAQQEAVIGELEQRLLSPKINDAQRAEVALQLAKAKEAYQQNLNAPKNIYMGSIEGHNMRGQYGTMAEFGRAGSLGLLAVQENAANMLQYLGDAADYKPLEEYGKTMKTDTQRDQRLVDLRAGDVDPTGGTVTRLSDVEEDPSKIFKFMGTTLLTQGPLMGAMIGGSVAGGALLGGVGSLVAPMMIGIGDVYGEMPDDEKQVLAAGAIGAAIGLVDRFGFSKGSIKPMDLINKSGRDKVISKIATLHTGGDIVKARSMLNTEMRSLGKEYAIVAKNVVAEQLVARKGISDILYSITKSSGKEASTETLQEAMQALGIASVTSVDVDYSKLYERVKEAAVAGGLLGGALDVGPAMYSRSIFNQQLNQLSGVETNKRTDNSLMAQEERARHGGRMIDDIQLADSLKYDPAKGNDSSRDSTNRLKPLESLIQPGDKSSLVSDAVSLTTEGGLFSSSSDNAVRPYVQFQGGRELGGLIDAKIVRGVYGGLSPFKRIHMIANSLMSMLPTHSGKRNLFGTDNSKEIGTILMGSLAGTNPNQGAIQYRDKLNEMGRELAGHLRTLSKTNDTGWDPSTIASPDFFLNNQIMDPVLVSANTDEFVNLLAKHWKMAQVAGYSPNTSFFRDLTERIKDNLTHREVRDLMDLGVMSNPAFDKFKSKDVEQNVVRMIEAISRGAVRNSIFGPKGEVLARAIYKMLDAGEITKEQASKLALDMQQHMENFDGNLGKLKSPLAKATQDNLTFLSLMSYMDTSLFANLGELVFGALGLPANQVPKYFGKVAKVFAGDVFAKVTQLGSKLTKGTVNAKSEIELSDDIYLLSQTGHYGHMNDIAFNVGANITTQSKRNMSAIMFKINLVESATNAARAVRASFAHDAFNQLTAIIAESPNDNNLTRWARDRLQYYRIDPDEMVRIYKQIGDISLEKVNELAEGDPLFKVLRKQLGEGTVNFIDEFSSRPEPGSTPKLLSDHRFMLFTQFKKFTYHVSANIVPHLWGMYIKRGDAQLTYSAFSMAIMAFAVAYAGMYLKAMFRGEEGDDDKLLARRMKQAFDYSWGQAPSDLASTIGTATKPGASVPDTIIRLSPAANLARNIIKDTYKATVDSDEKAKMAMIKRIPAFGEVPAVRQYFEKE